MILEHLKTSGVQQAQEGRPHHLHLDQPAGPAHRSPPKASSWKARREKRAAIFIGPEFGTVSRADLTAAAREAMDARFDALIACGFNFEAHTSRTQQAGAFADPQGEDEPRAAYGRRTQEHRRGQSVRRVRRAGHRNRHFDEDGEIVVEVKGIDVFDPKTGEIRSNDKDDIAAWFIDTDYNEESFFVRHAYFMGANDPYKIAQDGIEGRDRRGRLGHPLPRHVAPVPAPGDGPLRGKGHQSLRRRGDEGVCGVACVRSFRPDVLVSQCPADRGDHGRYSRYAAECTRSTVCSDRGTHPVEERRCRMDEDEQPYAD